MKHILAYGHSDQASFRTAAVLGALDYLSVPGTIAAYYPEATAAFVLTSQLRYLIDPRTPLFQSEIGVPRPSHFALAEWHGLAVAAHLGKMGAGAPVYFGESFYTTQVIAAMTKALVARQRAYATAAAGIQDRMARYAALRAAAMSATMPLPSAPPSSPAFILAPYFVITRAGWRSANEEIWAAALTLSNPMEVSPVVAVNSLDLLAPSLKAIPLRLSQTVFFWISQWKEREVPLDELIRLRDIIKSRSELRLINLYGGYFSICLGLMGLWAFNNGLGYSESRDWPSLTKTGAGKPRYYVEKLHLFTEPAIAATIARLVPAWACPCAVCTNSSLLRLSTTTPSSSISRLHEGVSWLSWQALRLLRSHRT